VSTSNLSRILLVRNGVNIRISSSGLILKILDRLIPESFDFVLNYIAVLDLSEYAAQRRC